MIKQIAAQYVYTCCGQPIRNGVVQYDSETGMILAVKPLAGETAATVHCNGVLVPGLVNAHCHLELSHSKGLVGPCRSLLDFLERVREIQKTAPFSIEACRNADRDMYEAGISLVGDISNTDFSAPVKLSSKISYVTFVELIGTTPERIASNIGLFAKVSKAFKGPVFAAPHAPYSVSPAMLEAINAINSPAMSATSIHNQETADENELYISHSGDFVKRFPLDLSPIPRTGKTSLQSCASHFRDYKSVLLVHNTFSSRADFVAAVSEIRNPSFVLCPKSNLYIEGVLPDIGTMLDLGLNLCLGTDSLSSNDTLSILEEMKVLRRNFRQLTFENLIQMATANGARALNQQENFGTLQPGKSPGLVLIENFDFQEMNICAESFVRRIC